MLDTKLKKMRRLKDSIIILCALIPALILVALYPKMEAAMLKEQGKFEKEIEENAPRDDQKWLAGNFVNYAVEASYYIYGQLRQQQTGTAVDFSVLDEYGWINDYFYLNDQTIYYAELDGSVKRDVIVNETDLTEETVEDEADVAADVSEKTVEDETDLTEETVEDETGIIGETTQEDTDHVWKKTNTEIDLSELIDNATGRIPEKFEKDGMQGFLTLEYDAYGQLSDIRYAFGENVDYTNDFYRSASDSVERYLDNAAGAEDYEGSYDYNGKYTIKNKAYTQVCPKGFKVVFALYDSEFLSDYNQVEYYGWDVEDFYINMGAYWIVIALAVLVALAAILLPFVKQFHTGWEKLFCMPFEIIVVLIEGGIAGAIGMFMAMSHTTMTELEMIAVERPVNFLGMDLSASTMYAVLLVLNFLGWAVLFFAEYVVIASLRQFFCNPKYYIQNRLLIVKVLRWAKKQLKKLYDYVTDIDINDKLTVSIMKIVLVNFGILTILCSLWFFGILGLIIYSVLLFLVLRKYGEKLQKQYKNILNATNQMAEGNLKITLDEDLGILQPLGDELEKVQQGFAKAVAEEAKSQSMKTELITNVSHDLKTPLTAIITYVDLLKKEDITEKERDAYIATIDQKSQRLKVLIEDLFEVSKANSGNIQMHFMDVDVVNLMKQVRLEMEEKIVGSDLNFRWNLPDKHVILSLDGARTYRIFENLLNNILKYSLPHTRVYIDILDLGTEVQILFRNISAVELEGDGQNLTERFVRGDASRKTEGSGLGLAIVKSFVELQNGKLNIDVDGDLFKVSIIWKRG